MTSVVAFEPSSAPSLQDIQRRLTEIQSRFPDLRLYLTDSGKDQSKSETWVSPVSWRQRNEEWPSEDVLGEHIIPEDSTLDAYVFALNDMERRASVDAILFRVLRIESPSKVYVTLSIWHAFCDGTGLINTLRALLIKHLNTLPDESRGGFFFDSIGKPAPSIPLKPSGQKPEPEVNDQPPWPHTDYLKKPLDCPQSFCELSLSGDIMDKVKSMAKSRGIPTLNPVLIAAFLQAAAEVLSIDDRNFYTRVPRSYRKASNPYLHGSKYNSAHEVQTASGILQRPFWTVAEEIRKGTLPGQTRGETAVEGPPEPRRSALAVHRSSIDTYKSDTPYDDTLTWSNLAKLGWLDDIPGVVDVIWGQSMGVFFPPFVANVCGWKEGVRATVGFREDSIVSTHQMQEIGKNWTEILRDVAADGISG